MKEGRWLFLIAGIFLLVGSFGVVSAGEDSFEVSSLLLKFSVASGDSVEKSFTVEADEGGEFSVNVIGIDGVLLSEENFVLDKGESRKIKVSYDSYGREKGISVGNIKVSNSKKEVFIPLIMEVESLDVFFDVNLDISPTYSKIEPGEKLIAQLKIFDLVSVGTDEELGAKEVSLKYYVYDLNGNVLVSEEEDVVVERQTQLTKTVSFPSDLTEGDYVFAVAAEFGSSVGTSSYLFSVSKERFGLDFDGALNLNFIAVLLVIVVVFFGIIFLFVYLMRDRDKLILGLRGYHKGEMKRQKRVLVVQAKDARKKGVSRREIRKAVKKAIKKLKNKQKTQIKVLRGLKRKKRGTGEMQKKLNEWKGKGYSTFGLEYKSKKLSTEGMKKIMSQWGKKYKKKK